MSESEQSAGCGPACAVVLAAGQGTRMRSASAKVLQKAQGAPLLGFVLEALERAGISQSIVVTGYGRAEVEAAFAGRSGVRFAEQREQLGTGDAVLAAEDAWRAAGAPRRVLVCCGDAPLVRPQTFAALLGSVAGITGASAGIEQAAATVLTAEVPDATGYGRIIRAADGSLERIVEHKDAGAAERAVREINAGAYAFDAALLWDALRSVRPRDPRPREREHYLTDVIAHLRAQGHRVAAERAPDWREALGVNTRAELAEAGRVLLERTLAELADSGVTIPFPDKVVVGAGAVVGEGTVIHPFSVIEPGVRVGRGCEVGPFAHLASGTVLEDGAAIGNFVEVKRSRIGPKAKAKHLAYIGDGQVGAGANIGAGTVFCNYDGKHKHTTTLGAGAFVGSGSMLVAPCEIGPGGRTGAGTVLKRGTTIAAGETWVGVPARRIAQPTQAEREQAERDREEREREEREREREQRGAER